MSRSSSNRNLIIRSARHLFYTRGFEHTSLADLAQDSGVNKGSFYYHFPSKDDVLRAVIEARLLDIDAALERWQQEHATPRLRLVRFVHMITSERDALVAHGCPTGSLLSELGKGDPSLHQEAVAILERYVEQGQSARDIVADGFDETIVRDIIGKVDRNEYKRKQAAPGLKITPLAFGIGRRMPIVQKFKA